MADERVRLVGSFEGAKDQRHPSKKDSHKLQCHDRIRLLVF